MRNFILMALFAALLSACGKRGDLEPPPGAAPPDPDEPALIDPLIKPE